MEKPKIIVEQIDSGALLKCIAECEKQIKVAPHIASLLVIYSGFDTERSALMVGHSVYNPETIATALMNEAMLFNRAKEVLESCRLIRGIVDCAEKNIEAELKRQSSGN